MHRVSPLLVAALAMTGCAQPAMAPPHPAAPRHAVRSPQQGAPLAFAVQQRSGYQYPYYYGAYYPYSGIYAYGPPISPKVEKELEEQAEQLQGTATASQQVARAG